MIYNKLVRDKIPEIIAKSGKKAKVRIVQGEELKRALKNKLVEEANELLRANTKEAEIEELADVCEVLLAILYENGISTNKIAAAWVEKNSRKGRLEKGYFLESVEELSDEA